MSHKIIRINSEERSDPTSTSSSDFVVYFPNVGELCGVNQIVVKSISIPFVQYNIKVGTTAHTTTNTFTFFDGAVNQTITLPVGNYSISQLILALQADAAAVAVGLAITLSPTTGHLVFTSTAPVTYLDEASGNNMARLLGILADSGPAVLTFTGQGAIDLAVHPNLYFASRALSDGSAMISPTLGAIPVFATVPLVGVAWGDIIQYRAFHPEFEDTVYPSISSGKQLNSIDITVYDGDGQVVDLQGLNWTLVLKATITGG